MTGSADDGEQNSHENERHRRGSRQWLDRQAGGWVAASLAWTLGVAAAVLQFLQAAPTGSKLYDYFFALFALTVGLVLLAYTLPKIKGSTVRDYLIVLLACAPLLFGTITLGFTIGESRRPAPPSRPLSTSIVEPVKDQLVGHEITVKGVVVNLPPEKEVWILATGRMDDIDIPYQYYAQGEGPCRVANNNFECDKIFVGERQDSSRYLLIPIVTDRTQGDAFIKCRRDEPTRLGCALVRPDGIQHGAGVFVKRQ